MIVLHGQDALELPPGVLVALLKRVPSDDSPVDENYSTILTSEVAVVGERVAALPRPAQGEKW